jgi:hypothetical protein
VINSWGDLYSRKEFKIKASYSDLQYSESDEPIQGSGFSSIPLITI